MYTRNMYIDTKYIDIMYTNVMYIYIYIIKVNYAINRIHNEKSFRSDLSTQIKNLSPLTNYLLRITFPVIYLY